VPEGIGNKDVPESQTHIEDMTGYAPIVFSGQSFAIGKALCNTTKLNYIDDNGTHGYVQVSDVVIECRRDEHYAIPQKTFCGVIQSEAYINVHIPKDTYRAVFHPVLSLMNCEEPPHVLRVFGTGIEPKTFEYCVLSPKYMDDLRTTHNDKMQSVSMKYVVDAIAARCLDLVVTVLVKCQVLKCSESGLIRHMTNCLIVEALMMGVVSKSIEK
jgi:hypothetical protein